MAPPPIVLAKDLTFIDGDRQVTVAAGTVCTVFNHRLTPNTDGEELLKRAIALNAKTGTHTHLVMIVEGRPRLLLRSDTCLQTKLGPPELAAAPIVKAPKPPPPARKKQACLFGDD